MIMQGNRLKSSNVIPDFVFLRLVSWDTSCAQFLLLLHFSTFHEIQELLKTYLLKKTCDVSFLGFFFLQDSDYLATSVTLLVFHSSLFNRPFAFVMKSCPRYWL